MYTPVQVKFGPLLNLGKEQPGKDKALPAPVRLLNDAQPFGIAGWYKKPGPRILVFYSSALNVACGACIVTTASHAAGASEHVVVEAAGCARNGPCAT